MPVIVLQPQVLVRLIAYYRIKLHAPLIGLVNRQIFWILILQPYSSGGNLLSYRQPRYLLRNLIFIVYSGDYQGI